MTQTRSSFFPDDVPAGAIARWDNEGGFIPDCLERLSLQMQRDLLELSVNRAAYMAGLDDEGALRPFHSFPWAIPSNIVE